jgi:hypothetical protein
MSGKQTSFELLIKLRIMNITRNVKKIFLLNINPNLLKNKIVFQVKCVQLEYVYTRKTKQQDLLILKGVDT